MIYLILTFLVFLGVILTLVAVQLLRIERVIVEMSERVEMGALRRIE